MLKEKIFVLLIYLISVISSQTIEIEKAKVSIKQNEIVFKDGKSINLQVLNNQLIDIIGEEGNSSDHIKDKTYRRKASITKPNTRFDTAEWDVLGANSFDGIGSHSSALSTKNSAFESFKMFPNPTNGDQVYFRITEATTINIYNILGKLVFTSEITKNKNVINLSKLSKGIYLVKIDSDKKSEIKKLVKN